MDEGLRRGASYVDVRFQRNDYELYYAENGVLKDVSYRRIQGVGIRVLRDGALGFASTSDLSWRSLLEALERALATAGSVRGRSREVRLGGPEARRDRVRTPYKLDPFLVERGEKSELVLEANREASKVSGVRNSVTRLGMERDRRLVISSEGADVEVETVLVGFSHFAVAGEAGSMERYYDSESAVAGYEFLMSRDWREFAVGVASKALEASRARVPSAGKYTVVADPELVGLVLHEAFGHAAEGDLVESGGSVLRGKLGERVASEHVTIVDDGSVPGGYTVRYDDEGVPKTRTVIVERGVLRSYLHSRETALLLGGEPTGNARAQDFSSIPLVRQTNLYMAPGDWRLDEMIAEAREGLLVSGKGSMGGEVDPGMGTFTFSAGPSYVIRKGELAEMVRGVSMSGLVLETLRNVEGATRELRVTTSVFGGCGKHGQMVRVGDGGPYVLIRNVTIGGRS